MMKARHGPWGFTLVEAMVALIVVSVMFVAALTAVAAARAGDAIAGDRVRGLALAEDLMSEVLRQPYEESSSTFGPDSGEAGATRSAFDDVDDYHGYSESPAATKSGAAIADTTGWTRRVTVERVDASTPNTVVSSDSGAKRVTVTVLHGGRAAAELVAVRTEAWQDPVDAWDTP